MFYNIENISKKFAILLCITKFLCIFVIQERTIVTTLKITSYENKRRKDDDALAFDQFKEI